MRNALPTILFKSSACNEMNHRIRYNQFPPVSIRFFSQTFSEKMPASKSHNPFYGICQLWCQLCEQQNKFILSVQRLLWTVLWTVFNAWKTWRNGQQHPRQENNKKQPANYRFTVRNGRNKSYTSPLIIGLGQIMYQMNITVILYSIYLKRKWEVVKQGIK